MWIFQICLHRSTLAVVLKLSSPAAGNQYLLAVGGIGNFLGTYSVFKGSIPADQSISLATVRQWTVGHLHFGGRDDGFGRDVQPRVLYSLYFQPIHYSQPLCVGNFTSKIDTIPRENTGGADLVITTNVCRGFQIFSLLRRGTPQRSLPDSVKQIYITYTYG